MKYERITVSSDREEKVTVYARENNPIADRIESIISTSEIELIGSNGRDFIKILPQEVLFFTSEDTKVYAVTEKHGKLLMKFRLYQLEEKLSDNFIRINQSCLANIRMIERFNASISGTLLVIFKNGSRDYVSRRQLSTVKKRIGIKK